MQTERNAMIFKLFFIFSFVFRANSYFIVRDRRLSSRSNLITVNLGRGFGAPKAKPFEYSGKLKKGKLGPKLDVPNHIQRPDYYLDGIPKQRRTSLPWVVLSHPPELIEKMRVAGRIAREVLDEAVKIVRPGLMTMEIDELVHAETIKRNAYPSPLNYNGFPKSCCTSINEIICHGIPDDTVLQEGDIVNIDVTCYYNGVHGDCSETVFVGKVSDDVKDLVVTTYECWKAAIAVCKPGVKYNKIGAVIEDFITPKGYTSSKDFCGHGIHEVFHDNPNILHYKNNIKTAVMEPGHTFTIEPMICMGSNKCLPWPDEWTMATIDGKWTAQFEHTLLITDNGVEELTAKLPTSPKYSWEQ